MPLKNDYEDLDFSLELRNLTDLDKEKIDRILELLNSDELVELTDAVTKKDKEKIKEIISVINKVENDEVEEISDLFNEPKKDNITFSVGDEVMYKKEKGTIRIPDGPGDTVGVVIKGKVKMVDRDKIKKIDESIMGFANIPSIQRIQALAGLNPETTSNPTYIEVEDKVDPDQACCVADNALTELENAIPNMRVSDLQQVRERLNNIFLKMNG